MKLKTIIKKLNLFLNNKAPKENEIHVSVDTYLKILPFFEESFMKYGEIRIFSEKEKCDFMNSDIFQKDIEVFRDTIGMGFALNKGYLYEKIVPKLKPTFYK